LLRRVLSNPHYHAETVNEETFEQYCAELVHFRYVGRQSYRDGQLA